MRKIIYYDLKFIKLTLHDKGDKLIWTHSHDGELSFKDSYLRIGQIVGLVKLVCHVSITPSKTITFCLKL